MLRKYASTVGFPFGRSFAATPGILHVVATALGIKVGGWHDFRHALVHTLRVHGVHSKVVSKMVGHASEAFTERVYDHAEQKEIGNALAVMGKRLAPSVAPNARLQ